MQDFLKQQEDYLTATLLDFFRTQNPEREWFYAVKIASNQISRLSNNSSEKLEKRFIFLASKFKDGLRAAGVRCFAKDCLEYALKLGLFKEEKQSSLTDRKDSGLKKQASKSLQKAIDLGHSKEAALNRAANELFFAKKDQESKASKNLLAKNHPMREVLSGLMHLDKKAAKEDIRNHFLFLKRTTNPERKGEGTLFGLLTKARSFSIYNLHQLLGDELFFLCKPIGFLDKMDSTVVVEVPSNAHQNLLTYRKLEILQALKKDNIFNNAKNIHFRIKAYTF